MRSVEKADSAKLRITLFRSFSDLDRIDIFDLKVGLLTEVITSSFPIEAIDFPSNEMASVTKNFMYFFVVLLGNMMFCS